MPCGYISAFRSGCEWWRSCWRPAASDHRQACQLRRGKEGGHARPSSTTPAWSTARQSQCFTPPILSTTSSRCHLSPTRGRRRRIWLANCWPNFSAHCRTVSWLTMTERAFGLACPVKGQDTRGCLNQPKIFVGNSGQDRGVPQPEDDDQNEAAYERSGFECAAPDPPRNG
jgi:hypothetical protein